MDRTYQFPAAAPVRQRRQRQPTVADEQPTANRRSAGRGRLANYDEEPVPQKPIANRRTAGRGRSSAAYDDDRRPVGQQQPQPPKQRRQRQAGTGNGNRGGNSWTDALAQARSEIGVRGFQLVRIGTPLYERAREIQAENGNNKPTTVRRRTAGRQPTPRQRSYEIEQLPMDDGNRDAGGFDLDFDDRKRPASNRRPTSASNASSTAGYDDVSADYFDYDNAPNRYGGVVELDPRRSGADQLFSTTAVSRPNRRRTAGSDLPVAEQQQQSTVEYSGPEPRTGGILPNRRSPQPLQTGRRVAGRRSSDLDEPMADAGRFDDY